MPKMTELSKKWLKNAKSHLRSGSFSLKVFHHHIRKKTFAHSSMVTFLIALFSSCSPELVFLCVLILSADLSIEKVKHTENTSRAYVKFKSVNDVELAIKRNDKQTNVRIYRSTNQQMKTERKQDSVPSMTSRSSPQHDSTESHRASEFMKVRGLPWNTEKAEIIALFPGK